MIDEIKPGDLIAISGKGLISRGIQLGSLSVPNFGPLGRWGLAGYSHVAIVAPIYGRLVVYESTSMDRPPCLRTRRENPKGVQVHYLDDLIAAGGDVWHFPLRRSLYEHEVDRLLNSLEMCIGRGYDWSGAACSGGGKLIRLVQRLIGEENVDLIFCSELVIWAWCQVGILQHKNAGAWNPTRVVREPLRRGVIGPGRLLT